MPWHVTPLDSPRLIQLTCEGLLEPGELADAMAETISQVLARECFEVLADCSGLEGGHTVLDLDKLAQVLTELGIGARLKEALILPRAKPMEGVVRFWEMACLARHLNVQGFARREDAIAWLTADAVTGDRTAPRPCS